MYGDTTKSGNENCMVMNLFMSYSKALTLSPFLELINWSHEMSIHFQGSYDTKYGKRYFLHRVKRECLAFSGFEVLFQTKICLRSPRAHWPIELF